MFPIAIRVAPVPSDCQWLVDELSKLQGEPIERLRIWAGDVAGRLESTARDELWMITRRMTLQQNGCWYIDHPAKARSRSGVWLTFTGEEVMKFDLKCGDRACVSPLCARPRPDADESLESETSDII